MPTARHRCVFTKKTASLWQQQMVHVKLSNAVYKWNKVCAPPAASAASSRLVVAS